MYAGRPSTCQREALVPHPRRCRVTAVNDRSSVIRRQEGLRAALLWLEKALRCSDWDGCCKAGVSTVMV